MDKQTFYRNADPASKGPLEGVRVLEATNYAAGPVVGTVLADFGATSIKCERPVTGDPLRQLGPFLDRRTGGRDSIWHLAFNRNKLGITLDFSKPEGQEIFRKLVLISDIVVENFTPGTMDQWGLGYQHLAELKKEIIYVSVSGFGQFGPLHAKKGFDPIAQAMSGLMSATGERDGRPLRAGFAFGDDLSGWQGAMGAMAAIIARDRTGVGQHVEVGLTDALLAASDVGIIAAAHSDWKFRRYGNSTDSAAPFNTYRSQDGEYVFINGAFDQMWRRMCEVMERPELADDPRTATLAARARNVEFVDEVVSAWTERHDARDIVAMLERVEAPVGQVLDFDQVVRHEHFIERESVAEVEHPEHGKVKLYGVGVKFSVTPARIKAPAPDIGQHNAEVYEGLLGYGPDQLMPLTENKII